MRWLVSSLCNWEIGDFRVKKNNKNKKEGKKLSHIRDVCVYCCTEDKKGGVDRSSTVIAKEPEGKPCISRTEKRVDKARFDVSCSCVYIYYVLRLDLHIFYAYYIPHSHWLLPFAHAGYARFMLLLVASGLIIFTWFRVLFSTSRVQLKKSAAKQ